MSNVPSLWGDLPVPTVGVPGDPAAVRTAASSYDECAALIATTAAQLRDLALCVAGESQAVAQLRLDASDAADAVEATQGRYRTVGTALRTYADVLAGAQESARDALARASSAAADHDDAQAAAGRAHLRADEASDEDERARQLRLEEGHRDEALSARARYDRAVDDLDAARDDQRRAAADAAATIAAAHDDGLDDSAWRNVTQVLAAVAHSFVAAFTWVDAHMSQIAALLAILSIALFWFPGLNALLEALSLIAGLWMVAKRAGGVVEAYQRHEGVAEAWRALGFETVGLASFGVSRVAMKGLELASVAGLVRVSQRKAVDAAKHLAEPSTLSRLAATLDPRTVVMNTLEQAAEPRLLLATVQRHRAELPSIGQAWAGVRADKLSVLGFDKALRETMKATRTPGGLAASGGIVAAKVTDWWDAFHDVRAPFRQEQPCPASS